MLMDEPFGAVDPIVRERLQNEFLRLHRTLGHDRPVRDPRHRRGDQDGQPRGGHAAGWTTRPVRAADRAAAEAGQRLRGPVRRHRSRPQAPDAAHGLGRRDSRRPSWRTSGEPARSHVDQRARRRIRATCCCSTPTTGRAAGSTSSSLRRPADRSRDPKTDPSSPIVTFETTLRDALSMLLASAVQTAVVVDEARPLRGRADPATRSARRSDPRRSEAELEQRAVRSGEPLILWDWTFSHLGEIWFRVRRAPGVDRHRRRRRPAAGVRAGAAHSPGCRSSMAPVTWVTGVLYTIPSLALFALLVPFTGLSIADRGDRADQLHAADPGAEHRGWHSIGARRRARGGGRHGLLALADAVAHRAAAGDWR